MADRAQRGVGAADDEVTKVTDLTQAFLDEHPTSPASTPGAGEPLGLAAPLRRGFRTFEHALVIGPEVYGATIISNGDALSPSSRARTARTCSTR
jgi:hypothetical protein